MKTNAKNTKLSLEKFQIAKLDNLHTLIGGAKAGNEDKEFTTTDTWTTLTYGG